MVIQNITYGLRRQTPLADSCNTIPDDSEVLHFCLYGKRLCGSGSRVGPGFRRALDFG